MPFDKDEWWGKNLATIIPVKKTPMTDAELELARSQVKELRDCDATMTPRLVVGGPYPAITVCTVIDEGNMWGLPETYDPPTWEPIVEFWSAKDGDPIPQASHDAEGYVKLRNSAAAFARSLESLLAERDALAAKCGELEAGLQDAYKWFEGNINLAQADHESPPEPADAFSYECSEQCRWISVLLANTKGA